MLLVKVSVGVRDAGSNTELSGRAIFTGRGDAERIRICGRRAGSAGVAAVAAGQPGRLFNPIDDRGRAGWRWRG